MRNFLFGELKPVCWRPKEQLIECISRSKCFDERRSIEDCVTESECFLERKNWVLCKLNSTNPRYRLRGNPYDTATVDQKKIEARNERIMKRELEDEGIFQAEYEKVFQKHQPKHPPTTASSSPSSEPAPTAETDVKSSPQEALTSQKTNSSFA